MDKTERERMLARRRQARRRERLRAEGVSVTVTLTHDEAAQLEELRQVRRMGKHPYSPNEFFQLLLIRNWQQWEKEKAPQRKARGLKKRYGFSRNNPPSCKAILSTAPAATPRPHISPVPVSGLCDALGVISGSVVGQRS